MGKRVTVLRNSRNKIQRDLRALLERRVQDAALSLHREWVRVLSTPGQGRTYRRGAVTRKMKASTARARGLNWRNGRGVVGYRFHRASRPGDPPAVDTGRLRASIDYYVNGLQAAVGTGLDYAASLEFGTRTIAPRPHGRTALARFKAEWKRNKTRLATR